MRAWLYALGGLIVWAIHFVGVYVIASLGDTVSRADDLGWRMAGLAFSGLCALAALGLLTEAIWRQRLGGTPDPTSRFMAQLAALGGGAAFIAIVWQALPTLIGF